MPLPKDTNENQTKSSPTISQLDHNIPIPTIEELLDKELRTPDEPCIQTMQPQTQNLPIISSNSSLLHSVINHKGNAVAKYLTYYQNNFLDSYPTDRFTHHWQALFHIDSGANVHATNIRSDFLLFHPIRSTINI